MKSMTKALVAGAFVVGFGLGSVAKGGEAVGGAQTQSKPFMMQRVYTGTDGLSHVEHIPSTAIDHGEGHRPRTDVTPPKRPAGPWHVGPERR